VHLSPGTFHLFIAFWNCKFCRKTIKNLPRPMEIWLVRLITEFRPLVINDKEILLATKVWSSCIIKWMGLRLLITRKLQIICIILSSVSIYAWPLKFRKSELSERRNYWMENYKYYVCVRNMTIISRKNIHFSGGWPTADSEVLLV
jgi:hypothetical protein